MILKINNNRWNFIKTIALFLEAVAPKHINRVEGNIIVILHYKIPIGKIFKLNIIQLLK